MLECVAKGGANVLRQFVIAAIGVAAVAPMALAGKDTAPVSACDVHSPGSLAWSRCTAPAAAAMSDEKLFYAGYWMARLGRYHEAIAHLAQVRNPDARALTYLGFATRKSGDVAGGMRHYARALALDPNFVVARAYLGEAHLERGAVADARRELGEIARRCGATCAAYDELARHVARYEAERG